MKPFQPWQDTISTLAGGQLSHAPKRDEQFETRENCRIQQITPLQKVSQSRRSRLWLRLRRA